ncbi:2'-5' RNA ligase family protein [Candidatus Woesearchaeota archaeon]|jgi:2'-5' RNA ligase|nr:2'-5' RNA ligase family protein [Candidatus Woesearchaeota archaeon]MBT3538386.1 2'-5' RNA ligase family protein [Candidatus Woesearchaeota archaeon]MBT4697053.1 2'-5' RNA ligase family protein [Candidatus Woesearchaeota archaeon]MBT4716379.1 2'-5' RNA ligase family protein [Candidatus Woesearchaeota archaeon]MBT7106055.1 2'-5' RNA ligase family protein [Candidatus Woesearchaeota archaeon]
MKRQTNYYIEIRYFGKAKAKFKHLTREVDKKFKLKPGHKVPHITLIQPFKTENQRKLVSDFKRICSKYKLMKFTVDGIGVFPFFVVFARVKPEKELIRFRHHLMNILKPYCRIKDVNRAYKPHTTIALKMGFIKFFRIWMYLVCKPRIVFTNHVMRITLLKGQKILYEYDFTNRRLLNRRKAKSRKELSKTFKGLKRHKKK